MPNNDYVNEPNQSRSEDIIQSILDNTEYNEDAGSRIEYLLIELKNAIEGGGGGGGGVTSYSPLTEKPKIDNHTLQAGNNTSSDLGLQTKLTFDSAPTESSTNPVTSGGVYTALAAKANSTDVYNKSSVDTALSNKADKSTTYTKSEVDTALSSKQNTISDLSTIRSGAAAGATAVQPISGKGLSTNDYTNDEKTKLAGIAEGAEVNEIESIKVNNTTINPDANKVVNITVPTTAADVSALPDTTKYAAALSLTINSSTFVITGQLKDQNGDNLGTAQPIDLPLESVVVGGSYNSQTKKVILTLQNGNTIEFSVADLVSGLQTELSASNKLNPAFIEYDSTHRAVSDTEKSTWNSKQNVIDGTHKLSSDFVADENAAHKFATEAQLEQITTNKNNISKDEAALVELVDEGAKNLLIVTATSQTVNGVTFTVNVDGTVTANGTSTATISFVLNSTVSLESGSYVLSGCPSGGSWNSYYLTARSNGSWLSAPDFGNSAPINGTVSQVAISIAPGQVLNNLTFKPMLCTAASYAISPAFAPHRPSYQELYEMVKALQANQ